MEATIYLGATAQREHVYAELRITPGNSERMVTFTDHSQAPQPERVSISFAVLSHKHRDPRTAPDAYWLSSGQVQPEDRVIATPAIPLGHLRWIQNAWATEHMNDMHAECDHMTPEMLEPTPEQLAEYAQAHPHTPSYSLAQYWKLDNVACPVTGYRWGSAWLARTPDRAMRHALRLLIAEYGA